MEKRMMALLLAVILAFHTNVGALYGIGGVPARVQENGAALQPEEGEEEGNSGVQELGEGENEEGNKQEEPGAGNQEEGDGEGAAGKPREDGGGSEQVQAEHTITFDFNGGTAPGASPTAKVKDGENLNSIVPPVPVRTGYKFQYWLDASGRKYDTD